MDTEPITIDFPLACDVEHAFATYVAGEWWPARYSADPETFARVEITPRVGGEVVARHTGGGDRTWGEVRQWEPPHLLVHTFTLAHSTDEPTVVSVRFTPRDAGGCDLHFEHGGWNERNAADHGRFTDWPEILDVFAERTERPDSSASH